MPILHIKKFADKTTLTFTLNLNRCVLYYTYISYHFGKSKYQIGVTVNLQRRLKVLCMNDKKGCKIVCYQAYDNSFEATKRENELLKMKKQQLIDLIKENNPVECNLLK